MPKKKQTETMLSITLVKSPIGYPERTKATVKALGLRHINQTVVHADTPAMRGMLAKVIHMVIIEEQVAK